MSLERVFTNREFPLYIFQTKLSFKIITLKIQKNIANKLGRMNNLSFKTF